MPDIPTGEICLYYSMPEDEYYYGLVIGSELCDNIFVDDVLTYTVLFFDGVLSTRVRRSKLTPI